MSQDLSCRVHLRMFIVCNANRKQMVNVSTFKVEVRLVKNFQVLFERALASPTLARSVVLSNMHKKLLKSGNLCVL